MNRGPSPSLNFSSRFRSIWPVIARIQPIWEQTTVIGSRSIIASRGTSSITPASANVVRLRPTFLPSSTQSLPNCFLVARSWSTMLFHCRLTLSSRSSSPDRSSISSDCSRSSAISSRRRKDRRRMFRIASACTSLSEISVVGAGGM